MAAMDLMPEINRLPEGYSEGLYQGRRYGITKTCFNGGRSVKVFARALGGTELVSLNGYLTAGGEVVKPCEMPLAKVAAFLHGVQPLPTRR